MEKNLAHSFDKCLLQFLVHLFDLLSILLRYNGFARTEKAIVWIRWAAEHQTVTMTFCGASLALGSA